MALLKFVLSVPHFSPMGAPKMVNCGENLRRPHYCTKYSVSKRLAVHISQTRNGCSNETLTKGNNSLAVVKDDS
jgi:hypothetical protein